MASKFFNRLGTTLGVLALAVGVSVAAIGCGGEQGETVQGEQGGTPATGASGGKPVYQEDPASKAAGGSGMPLPPRR